MAGVIRPYAVVNVKISGDDELAKVFDGIPDALQDSVLREAGKKALLPVRDLARSLIHNDEGELKDSLIVSTKLSPRQKRKFQRRGDIAVYCGPTQPKGSHGILVEFGTGPRTQRKTGRYVGRMPAHPFMRPAWDTMNTTVLALMHGELWAAIVKQVRRLRKRAEAGKLSTKQIDKIASQI